MRLDLPVADVFGFINRSDHRRVVPHGLYYDPRRWYNKKHPATL